MVAATRSLSAGVRVMGFARRSCVANAALTTGTAIPLSFSPWEKTATPSPLLERLRNCTGARRQKIGVSSYILLPHSPTPPLPHLPHLSSLVYLQLVKLANNISLRDCNNHDCN
jgi:hypothetical protein